MMVETVYFLSWWLVMGAAYYLLTIMALHWSGDLEALAREHPAAPVAVLLVYLVVWPLFVLNHLRTRR